MKHTFKNIQACLPARQGFTLIEMLVVITIIGIISSFAVVSVNDARIKARDAKRQADIVQTHTALQVYFDKNDQYPKCSCSRSDCWETILDSAMFNESGKPYITPLPIDPLDKDEYYYEYCSDDGKTFTITYQLEQENDVKIMSGF
ncbi:MAG: type II secretion system protein [Patescibacteria group bacterium]